MNMMKKNGGFTLVELIVVIAILAILAGVAVPAYSSYISKANNTVALSELSNISTSATVANAAAGAISKITVVAATGDNKAGKLTVTIEATTFASDFADLFKSTYGTNVTKAESGNSYSMEITASKAWTSSEYAEKGATWTSAGWAKNN